MSGETEKDESAWTTDTLRTHLLALLAADSRRVEQRFESQEKAVAAALTAQKEATAAALSAAEKAVLLAQANAKDWQAASNEWRAAMNDRERTLMPRMEAEKGMAANAEKIDALAARIDRTEGRSGGINAGWGYLVGAVGLLATVIAIFFALSK
jgi:hypothetical protein